jgi:endogenous inhibitor of DNA gyrase (YacG/DUF329 family)
MTTTRACATCGQPFTVDPRTPRRRYCTPRCRAEDWRRRHTPTTPAGSSTSAVNAANAANGPNGVPRADAVTTDANPAPPPDDVADDDRRATLARCPHCQRPIAVLTLLVPPAAAHVATPQAHHG